MSCIGASIRATLLRSMCACVLLGVLVAGLWPFHAPRNEVSWLSERNGLLFGKHGGLVSAGPFDANIERAEGSCSLEIWAEPSRVNSDGTILAFYSPATKVVPFRLRQWGSGLELLYESRGVPAKKAEVYVGGVFTGVKPVLVTITSGKAGTAVYADGTLLTSLPTFTVSNQDLAGQLVVGNAPLRSFNWSGQITRLTIYNRELADAEVSRHFAVPTKSRSLGLVRNESVVADYLFTERKGTIVHNRVNSATDLLIPERFFVLDKEFLERPWDEFRPTWSYWTDVAVNVVGFIPVGCFFCGYLSTVFENKRAVWLTIGFGLAVSLTIEVSQAFLPTRGSGMTDLVTNTFGTALGTILWMWSVKINWLARPVGSSLFSEDKEEMLSLR